MNVRWSASNLTTPGGQTALVLPAALALTGGVTAGVAVLNLDDAGGMILLEIGVGVLVLFGAITAIVGMRTRARVALGWDGTRLRLEVQAPGRPVVAYGGPFREEHCFLRSAVHSGHGSIPQLTLMLAIFDGEGRCVVLLRELLGALYDPPPGWREQTIAASRPEIVLVNTLGRTNLDQLAQALSKG